MSIDIRVLVVDDSAFFRRCVVAMLNKTEGIEVVGEADNGLKAVQEAQRLRPDVITMDVEMPVMDGITAVKHIMAKVPTSILMFSALTRDGATATLDALDAGAVDFLPKDFGDLTGELDVAARFLSERILALGRRRKIKPPTITPRSAVPLKPTGQRLHVPMGDLRHCQLVVIGASTGGPVALQTILTSLPADFSVPILLVIHMPANFTPAYAERLDRMSGISVKEAADNDVLRPGLALLAPGGMQMTVERNRRGQSVVRVQDPEADQTYRPSVDVTFVSVADSYPKKALAVVLTGMGSDGLKGARLIKSSGSSVWSQDEASCVVFGMPQAVEKAGISDRVLPIDQIGSAIIKVV